MRLWAGSIGMPCALNLCASQLHAVAAVQHRCNCSHLLSICDRLACRQHQPGAQSCHSTFCRLCHWQLEYLLRALMCCLLRGSCPLQHHRTGHCGSWCCR
jgi:hypothetical protein